MQSLSRAVASNSSRARRTAIALGIACAGCCAGAFDVRAGTLTPVDLYTLSLPLGFRNVALPTTRHFAAGGWVVGDGQIGSVQHAAAWTAVGTAMDLHSANLDANATSVAFATNGAQTVGVEISSDTTIARGLLWTGGGPAVDITPTNLGAITSAVVYDTDGLHQAGYALGPVTNGQEHAILWAGTSVATDLHPTNLDLTQSRAQADRGSQIAGYGSGPATNSDEHALLWTSSNTAVDLNPTALGITTSHAQGVSGTQQVGFGTGTGTGGKWHALLWTGSAATAIDLNPTNLTGFTMSNATDTNGSQQVGYGVVASTGNPSHALLWNGTSEAVDLQALLPANFVSSSASTIDASGNVFGIAFDTAGNRHAVEWAAAAATPEPACGLVVGASACLLGLRRRRAR